MKKFDKSMFERVNTDFKDGDEIKTESLTFWQDAFRRLKQNKPAIISLYAIILLVVCSLVLPFIGVRHEDGTLVQYDEAPRLLDPETGDPIEKGQLNYLPPRIPGVEQLGIMDGRITKEMTTYELFVGEILPDEVAELNSPLTKTEFVEALGIKYHPYDYTIESWSGSGSDKEVTINVLTTGATETLPLSELMSEYSSYANIESFDFKETTMDAQGIQMLTLDVNMYIRNDIEHLYFYFGTDELGFDIFTRLWSGIQVSLLIGLLSLIVDFTVGILYGSIAGFFGGTAIDNVMMRFTEVLGSIPTTVIVILFLTIKEPFIGFIENLINMKLTTTQGSFIILVIAMSMTGWMGVARLVRAQYIKLKDQEFVMASVTLGASSRRLMFKHLFPNIIGQLVVMATFSIPGAIAFEAMLSFIGLGLPIPMSSLGVLLSNGNKMFQMYPYMMIIPAFFMVYLMLAINLLANGLRDALDPRLRGK